jgi:hypothetical protein
VARHGRPPGERLTGKSLANMRGTSAVFCGSVVRREWRIVFCAPEVYDGQFYSHRQRRPFRPSDVILELDTRGGEFGEGGLGLDRHGQRTQLAGRKFCAAL